MDSWKKFARTAHRLARKSDFEGARKEVFDGLEAHPDNFDLLCAAHDILFRSGEWSQSLEQADRLISCYPRKWIGPARAIKSLVAMNQFDKAKAKLQQALETWPDNIDLQIMEIDIYRAESDLHMSLRIANTLIAKYPDHPTAYVRAAQDLIQLNRFTDAQELVEKALKKFPKKEPLKKLVSTLKLILNKLSQYPLLVEAWSSRPLLTNQSMIKPSIQACPEINFIPFQYWSQGNPPDDITVVTEEWDRELHSIGLQMIHLFDKFSARQWIEENAEEFLISFDTAFHYAVEADIFRLAFATRNNCIWIDSDFPPSVTSSTIIQHASNELSSLLFWMPDRPRLNNAFFIARANCPFFAKISQLSRGIDFRKLKKNKVTVTGTFGPGKYNQALEVLFSENPSARLDKSGYPYTIKVDFGDFGLQFCDRDFIRSYGHQFAYKETADHWANLK